jgi:vancomycin resistance protein YoaR
MAGSESIQLDRAQLASIVSVRKEQVDGRTQVSLHLLSGETGRLLRPLAERVARPAVHARFNWTATGLTLAAPGVDGQELELETAAATLEQQVLTQAGPATLTTSRVPAIGLADAPALNIRELLLEGSVSLSGVDSWTMHNADHALKELHGRLVLPGQTFSLLEAIGPIRADRGYQAASDDSSVIGRGVNFAATSLMQAVFWSGFLINERHAPPHWTTRAGEPPRGQVGLDAAVDPAQQRDFKFTNDASQPLLIQASMSGDNATVALYGTRPGWNVQVSEPVVTGVAAPDTEPERRDDQTIAAGQEVWVEDRSDGFSVTLLRTVTADGSSQRTLNLTGNYAASRGRVLVGTRQD